MDLPTPFHATLKRLGADHPDAIWLVGVSGGLDSVCLLDLLVAAGLRPGVVHVNHGLRGADSDADAALVADLAKSRGLLLYTRVEDVRARAREWETGVEEAGRRVRHAFLREIGAQTGASGIFLAHHADDQAETVLWNILRGAGLRGLGGMAEDSEIEGLRLLRPLLRFSKRDLRDYAISRNLVWREDATNADPAAATRNLLRHDLLPLLEERLGRPVQAALTRLADLARQDDELLTQLAEREELHTQENLPVERLRALPAPLQTRVLRAWLRARGCPKVGLAEVQAVQELLEIGENGQGKARVNLPGDTHVERRQMRLSLRFANVIEK